MLVILLVLGLFLESEAYYPGEGFCPPIQTMESFNPHQATGHWYNVASNDPQSKWFQCTRVIFGLKPDGRIPIAVYVVDQNTGKNMAWNNSCSPLNGAIASYECAFPRHPGVLQKVAVHLLKTDYHNYMILYGCVTNGEFYYQLVWVLLRTPDLDDQQRTAIEDVLKANNIDPGNLTHVRQKNCH